MNNTRPTKKQRTDDAINTLAHASMEVERHNVLARVHEAVAIANLAAAGAVFSAAMARTVWERTRMEWFELEVLGELVDALVGDEDVDLDDVDLGDVDVDALLDGL